jgi:SPP1 gp7 family putative phage head morphogenesis protein
MSMLGEVARKLAEYSDRMAADYSWVTNVREDARRRRSPRVVAQVSAYEVEFGSWMAKQQVRYRNLAERIEATARGHHLTQWRRTIGEAANNYGLAPEAAQFAIAREYNIPRVVSEKWVSNMMQLIRSEGTSLVPSIPAEHFARLQRITQRAVHSGLRVEELRAQLEQLDGVSKRRAEVIARDQIGKYNGNMTRIRQEEVGSKSYIWRTSKDERVREEHQAREGKKYYYSRPPSDGNPGQPVQCRCWAEPDFDALFKQYEKGEFA